MELDTYTKWLLALWLAVPTTALHYWLEWEWLPSRIPTKYDAAGRAIAWASRPDALTLLLGILGFMLVLITAVGFLVGYQRPERVRPALVTFYVVIVVTWFFENRFVWSLAHG